MLVLCPGHAIQLQNSAIYIFFKQDDKHPLPVGAFALLVLFVFFFFCPFVLIDYKQEFAKKKKNKKQKP